MPIQSWSVQTEERLLTLRSEGRTRKEIVEILQKEFPQETFTFSKVKSKLQRLRNGQPVKVEVTPAEKVELYKSRNQETAAKAENKQLLAMLAAKDKEVEAALRISQTPQEYRLVGPKPQSLHTAQVILWSDFHSEELVRGASINHLNNFNEEVADQRIQSCITNTARLMEITAQDVQVDKVILWLGGDFISGNIHEELLENTWARPIDAILWVQERLIAGIKYLLTKTKVPIVVVCHPGNHSRITTKTHFSTEQGNSLEYFMYHNMRQVLKKEKRLEWIIAEGYHTYVELYGKTIRFHHGHAIKYGGGIGGIFIPTYKAISQWNKARRADLDCFGHFHQLKNGGNFICNGSLIGYNAFAVAIKADFEKPYQKFFMFTSTGEVTAEYPVFLD